MIIGSPENKEFLELGLELGALCKNACNVEMTPSGCNKRAFSNGLKKVLKLPTNYYHYANF